MALAAGLTLWRGVHEGGRRGRKDKLSNQNKSPDKELGQVAARRWRRQRRQENFPTGLAKSSRFWFTPDTLTHTNTRAHSRKFAHINWAIGSVRQRATGLNAANAAKGGLRGPKPNNIRHNRSIYRPEIAAELWRKNTWCAKSPKRILASTSGILADPVSPVTPVRVTAIYIHHRWTVKPSWTEQVNLMAIIMFSSCTFTQLLFISRREEGTFLNNKIFYLLSVVRFTFNYPYPKAIYTYHYLELLLFINLTKWVEQISTFTSQVKKLSQVEHHIKIWGL